MKFFNDSLVRVSQFVLEDWAMMLVDDSTTGSTAFDPNKPFFLARAEYTSVFCGSIYVFCQREFMQALADNLLGLDPDEELSEADYKDALKEFANVVSGNFLTDAFGEDAVFDLPIITVKECPFVDVERYLNEDSVYFIGDDIPVALRVEIAADEEAHSEEDLY